MRNYTQLTQKQRYQIYALMKAGHTQSETANLINVHKTTISRELKRNRGLRGYRPKQAHQFALSRRKKFKYRIEASTWSRVEKVADDSFQIIHAAFFGRIETLFVALGHQLWARSNCTRIGREAMATCSILLSYRR